MPWNNKLCVGAAIGALAGGVRDANLVTKKGMIIGFILIGAGLGAILVMIITNLTAYRSKGTYRSSKRSIANYSNTNSHLDNHNNPTVASASESKQNKDFNTCPNCHTENDISNLLCEFCGRRMPIKKV